MRDAITHGDMRFPIQAYTVPFDLPNHWHSEFEFLYMNKGSATYWVDTQPIELSEGDCGFASKGQMHSVDYHDVSASVFTALVFNPIILAGDFDACNFFFQGIADQRILIDHKYTPDTPQGEKVIKGLLDISDLLAKKPYAYEVRVKSLLYGIFAAIFEYGAYHVQYDEQIGNPKNAEKIKKVVNYIYNNYNQKITIEELSQLLNYSPYYFSRFFKELTGRTPIDYLNRYRIFRASELLRTTEVSISDAAFAVGFENLSYFIRMFRKYNSCTPSLYRKRGKG